MVVVFDMELGKLVVLFFYLVVIFVWIGSYVGIFWFVWKYKWRILFKEGILLSFFMMVNLKYESEVVKILVILVGIFLICFFLDVVFDMFGKVDEIRLLWCYILFFFGVVINFCVFVCRS